MTKLPWKVLFGGIVVVQVGLALFSPDTPMIVRIALLFSAALVFCLWPEIRVTYGTEGILLTFGFKRLWKVRIPREDVTMISIVKFSPIKDFGGWGIKFGTGKFSGVRMWAMPTKKNRAMFVEADKRKFLIGDEDPDGTLALLARIYPTDPGSSITSR